MRKQIIKAIFLSAVFFALPNFARAVINFDQNGKWETTFNYIECAQRGGGGATDCDDVQNDGIFWGWGADERCGNYTQVSSAANSLLGTGNGFRAWSYSNPTMDSSISQESTGAVKVVFPTPQKELWIRWYQKYQAGFNWLNPGVPNYDKTLYICTDGTGGVCVIPEFHYESYVLNAQGTVDAYQVGTSPDYHDPASFGWSDIMNGNVSDGQFHSYEIQIKMDDNGVVGGTTSGNGLGRFWVDGVLRAENENVTWSNGDVSVKPGWTYYFFENNQRYPDNINGPIGQNCAYVDYDDMTVYTSNPSNIDANGNPFIGPIGWVNELDSIAPSAPGGLSVM